MTLTPIHPLWEELKETILGLESEIRDLRRYLHRFPEPSNEEIETTRTVSEIMGKEGIQHEIAPSGRGIIANSNHPNGGKRIAMRADMDALRIQDEKQVAYRSTKDNLMHACGHDAHTAMLVGVITALERLDRKYAKSFTWRAIFQPAEETASGAKEMIELGAMKDVDAIFALHVDPLYPFGQVTSRPGALSAICEEVELTIHGRGGHGARPHQTIDPIAIGARLLNRIYDEIPRQVEGPEPSVISFGVFHAGINSNVIPQNAQLKGTLRTISEETSARIKQRIQEIMTEVETESGAIIRFGRTYHLPSVNNDPKLMEDWFELAANLCGQGNVIRLDHPSMGGEDFSYYLEEAPGCMLRLGVGARNEPTRLLHSPHFDIEENALVLGSQLLALRALTAATT